MQPTRIDIDSVRTEWANRGYTCELWIDAPEQVWRDFEHDVDELVFLLEGRATIDLDGRTGGFNLQVCWSTGFLAGASASS